MTLLDFPPDTQPVQRPVRRGLYLSIHDGDEVRLKRLDDTIVRIGSWPGCEVYLDDHTVSRRHALIVVREGWTVILDDRSETGVRVAGRPVTDARLHDGDVIQLGRVALRYLEVA
jgi:pSer/pThr/pTyr-binding forkhead associated (FHA) protein